MILFYFLFERLYSVCPSLYMNDFRILLQEEWLEAHKLLSVLRLDDNRFSVASIIELNYLMTLIYISGVWICMCMSIEDVQPIWCLEKI